MGFIEHLFCRSVLGKSAALVIPVRDGSPVSPLLWAQDYPCEATPEDMAQYLGYEAQQACPDDWLFVQELIFRKKCYALPRRRCRILTPPDPTEVLPLSVPL